MKNISPRCLTYAHVLDTNQFYVFIKRLKNRILSQGSTAEAEGSTSSSSKPDDSKQIEK